MKPREIRKSIKKKKREARQLKEIERMEGRKLKLQVGSNGKPKEKEKEEVLKLKEIKRLMFRPRKPKTRKEKMKKQGSIKRG